VSEKQTDTFHKPPSTWARKFHDYNEMKEGLRRHVTDPEAFARLSKIHEDVFRAITTFKIPSTLLTVVT
jgi:hypothetical protein